MGTHSRQKKTLLRLYTKKLTESYKGESEINIKKVIELTVNNLVCIGFQIAYFFLMIVAAPKSIPFNFGGLYLQIVLFIMTPALVVLLRRKAIQNLRNIGKQITYIYLSNLLIIILWTLIIIGFKGNLIETSILLLIVYIIPIMYVFLVNFFNWSRERKDD